jgi:hypothetical protein
MQGQKIEFDYFDFEDAEGNIRTVYQCSYGAQVELRSRLNLLFGQLQNSPHRIALDLPKDELLALTKMVDHLLGHDRYFAFLIDRCLELCGLRRNYLNPIMLAMFLFPHTTQEGKRDALLFELNNLSPRPAKPKGKPLSYEGLIASLLNFTESLEEAKRITDTIPAGQLNRIIEARNEQIHEARMELDKQYAENYWREQSKQRAYDSMTARQERMYGSS